MNGSYGNCVSAGRTDRGKVRELNEDAFLDCPERGLWVVADGMGGHQSGEVASRLIVSTISDVARHSCLDSRLGAVRESLLGVNHRLVQNIFPDGDRHAVIGSTVVALLIEGARAACIWAGDSRCYLWREQRLYQLSRDHSLLQELIDSERMSPCQAAQHPEAHALTRAVGGGSTLTLEVVELDVRQGDVFVLCSDGLYQALDPQMLSHALSIKSPRLSVDLLFDYVLRGAAADNLTAVVVRV